MYEATLSAACSFENFLEYIESEALNMRKVIKLLNKSYEQRM